MRRLIGGLLLACGLVLAQPTTVRETAVKSPAGKLATGTITITALAPFEAADQTWVDTTPAEVQVTNGAFTVTLEPNIPGPAYVAQWQLNGAKPRTEYWAVPASATPVGLLRVVTGQATATWRWRGAWMGSTAYGAYDTVSYAGSSYVALAVNTGVTPGSDGTTWGLMAAGGEGGTGGGAVSSVAGRTGDVVLGQSDIAGLVSALAGKAALTHVHLIGDVTGLQAALDGKAALSHVHLIADITGLQAALDGKQAAGSYEAPLTFASPLSRTGNTVSCPTCGSGAVASVFGRTGVVTAQSGDYDTSQVAENGNQYFTPARARAAFSATAPIEYDSSTGTIACPTCGAASTRTWNFLFQGVNYGSVPAFGGNIPSGMGPAAKVNDSGTLTVLDFPVGQSTYWYGSWVMPPGYPANGTIAFTISSMCDPANCDSINAANVYVSLSCTGASARPDAPSFVGIAAPVAIANAAGGGQTVTTGTVTPNAGGLPACAATNRAAVKLMVDTAANSLTGSFQLVDVSFFVQGQL